MCNTKSIKYFIYFVFGIKNTEMRGDLVVVENGVGNKKPAEAG